MTKRERKFQDLATYIRLHDGVGKPRINFQDLYKLFPEFTFTASPGFGSYQNFGGAFEAKVYDMIVDDGADQCFMHYREYGDAKENLAYTTI